MVRCFRSMVACLLLFGTHAAAQNDSYPNKPIRIITHSAAGGAPGGGGTGRSFDAETSSRRCLIP